MASFMEAIDVTEMASMEKMARIRSEAGAKEEEAGLHASDLVMQAEAIKEDAEATMAVAEATADLTAQAKAESLACEEAA